jgi:hypothetical protein
MIEPRNLGCYAKAVIEWAAMTARLSPFRESGVLLPRDVTFLVSAVASLTSVVPFLVCGVAILPRVVAVLVSAVVSLTGVVAFLVSGVATLPRVATILVSAVVSLTSVVVFLVSTVPFPCRNETPTGSPIGIFPVTGACLLEFSDSPCGAEVGIGFAKGGLQAAWKRDQCGTAGGWQKGK